MFIVDKQAEGSITSQLRPLNLEDFVLAKAKVC